MKRLLLLTSFITYLFAWCSHVQAQSQIVANGDATKAVVFPGSGCAYNWVNNTPGIGLPAAGSGDIASFTAVNTGNTPVVATIKATPVPSGIHPIAFMANQLSGTLSLYDPTNTLPMVQNIKVGSKPYGVAVSADGTGVYVSNETSGTVSVVSPITFTVKATIRVGKSPKGIAISRDGQLVYVANYDDGTVSVIGTTNNNVVTTITHVGLNPTTLVLNADGTRLFVSENSTGVITVVNTATYQPVTTINAGIVPAGMATNADGSKLYVANPDGNNVIIYNTATNAPAGTIAVGQQPFGLAISADDVYLYVSNQGANTVSAINLANNSAIAIPVGSSPRGLSVTADGSKVYVVNFNDGTASVISTATNSVTKTLTIGSEPVSLGSFVAGSRYCSSVPIDFTITVNPTAAIIKASGNLPALTTSFGVPSPSATFNLSGLTLGSGILVTPPAGFEVSTDDINFSNTLTVGAAGNVPVTSIYIRLSASTAPGNYSGNIVLHATGASDAFEATVSSTVTGPVPNVFAGKATGIISGCAGTPSASPNIGQFTVSAINLTGVFSATAPAGFEVSLDPATGYAVNVNIPATNGKAGNTIVYVRSSATALGDISGNVTISSPGAVSKKVPVKGIAHPLPVADPVSDKNYKNGIATTTIQFTGAGNNTFNWTNDNPAIGIPASGTGDINSFTPVNNGTSPIVANITAYPLSAPLAYISNLGSNTVSVINMITNTLAANFPVGQLPWDVVVSKDGSSAYVANYNSNTVSVINTATNRVVATVPVGTGPRNLSVSDDDSQIMVYNAADQAVSVIDRATNTVVATTALGKYPPGTLFSNDGKIVYALYVPLYPALGSLTAIDLATDKQLGKVTVGIGPDDAIGSPDGKFIYVSNDGSNSVSVISTANYTVVKTITVGSNPQSVALNLDGSVLYVANSGDNTISVINTATYAIIKTINVDVFPSAVGITAGNGCTGLPTTFTITVNPTPPTITASGTLDALSTPYSVASSSTSFTVSAVKLTEEITITPPPGFEVSTDDINFSSTVTAGNAGAVAPTLIYIRLAAGTAVGTYSGNIILSSLDAADVTVAMPVSTVTEPLQTIKVSQITGVISACAGTPSASPNIARFTASGSLLTDDVTVKAPSGFEVSVGLNSGYAGSIKLLSKNGSVANTAIYVRSSGTASGDLSGNILISSLGAVTRSLPVKGTITPQPSVSKVADQIKPDGVSTDPVTFAGTANTYTWTNDLPGIGLAASGAGDIASFTPINKTGSRVTAHITVTPIAAPFAYVALQNNNRVAIINTASNQVIKTIQLGGSEAEPYAVSASADGTKVYVANRSSGTVSVINTNNNTLSAPIRVGVNPSGIAASPDGIHVVVTNNNSNNISVINTINNTVQFITVGIGPTGVAFSPDGNTIYVANRNTPSVSVIDVITNTITNIVAGSSPEGIAVSPDGSKVYVTNYSTKSVSVISTATNTVIANITVGTSPRAVVFSTNGTMAYVTNMDSDNVTVINTGTNAVVATIPVGKSPQGIAASPDGAKIFVANYTSNQMAVINATNNTFSTFISVGGAPVSFGNFVTGGSGCTGTPMTFTISVDPSSPYITTNGTPTALNTTYGKASASTSFNVSGIAMKAAVLVTPPAGFEVSTDNINFGQTVTVGNAGSFSSAVVYLRLSAKTGAGNYTGNIVLSSTRATDVQMAVAGSEVDKAVLTIKANNATRAYGVANPTFTASYSGFVNGDGATQLTVKPIFSTTATLVSAAGQYPITVSGAASPNYSFIYVDGVLTISNVPLTTAIPNSFTPNGDGVNDIWTLTFLADSPNCTVDVFNRNGQKVYTSIGYATPWDGKFKSAALPAGTYYYVINPKDGQATVSGSVAILR